MMMLMSQMRLHGASLLHQPRTSIQHSGGDSRKNMSMSHSRYR